MGLLAAFVFSGIVRCPFAAITHLPCPGCGSTRAVRALMSLDIASAVRWNPAAPIIAGAIAVLAAEGLWLLLRDGHAGDLAMRGSAKWALRALLLAVPLQFVVWGLRFFGLFGGPVVV